VLSQTNSYHLTVSGDATGSQEGWIWVGRMSPPRANPASGICHASIEFVPAARGTGLAGLRALPLFSLTIGARGGLQVGEYGVGADETFGMDLLALREANPETFFAHMTARLSNPASELSRMATRMGAGAAFFSTGGHVSIDHIDDKRIEGSFRVTLRGLEQLDGDDQFQFINATATGTFAGSFAPDASRERLARINRPYEDVYNCR
jgi:hypothetical protein